jgi:hypothetical protein
MILGLCLGCRGLGWFRSARPAEWICPGCFDQRREPKPLRRTEFAYLRALRGHEGFTNGDLNVLYQLMVKGDETRRCERCSEKSTGVMLEGSRTMYEPLHLVSWKRLLLDGEGLGEVPDPNAPSWLCRPCAEVHKKYWDEMWSYASSY